MTFVRNHRRGLVALVAAAIGLTAGMAGAPRVHAATVSGCEADTSWTIANSIQPSTVSGQLVLNAGECAAVNSAGLPFEGVSTTNVSGNLAYTFEGTCAEGFLAFANGDVAVFVGGIILWERQGAEDLAAVGVLVPATAPCGGAPGSTMTWSGVVAAAATS